MLTFGQALELLKQGKAVARSGWNGKNMLLYLNLGSNDNSQETPGELIEGIRADLFLSGAEGTVRRLPNINMKAASGSTVTGWLASQTDMLAEDWVEIS